MADEEQLDFEDRFAQVPDETADPETELKKIELLKLAQQGITMPPDLATLPMKTPLQHMMPAPVDLPGAPVIKQPPVQAAAPEPDPQFNDRYVYEPPTPPAEPPIDIGKLSTGQVRPEGFSPTEDAGRAREVDVRPATADIKKFRGFTPEVERAIVDAAKRNGVDPDMLRAFVAIESNGDPNSNRNKRTQYKGLMQIGRNEWQQFGQGDIYNANDNIEAGARLLKDNAARFERVMGRPPTPREQYLMHQQGLGFYTRGSMTNIAGNLPASAKGDPNNWTHKGFENYWGNKLENLMAQARGAQVTGSVPMSELASFIGAGPTAQQKPELTGGLTQTPIAAEQTAALMTGTPIEKIKAITQIMNDRATAGAIKNVAGQTPRGVRPARGQAPVEGQLPQEGSVTHTRPDMLPIPGMDAYPNLTEAMNPSLMSTIRAYQGGQKGLLPELAAPQVAAPSDVEANKKPSFVQNAMKIASYLATGASAPVNPMALGTLAAKGVTDAVTGQLPTIPTIKDIADVVRGVGSGALQQPTDAAMGTVVPLVSAAGLLLGSEGAKDFAVEGIQGNEDYKAWARDKTGIDTVNPSEAAQAGEFIGRNVNPVNAVKTIMSVAGSMAGEVAQPYISKLAQNYPIPSLVTPANAATVFGAPPRVINTPGGPVIMNDASLSEFVYGGLLSLGMGFAPGVAAKTANYLKHNPTVMWVPNPINKWSDPRRPVAGAPGTVAASIPRDVLKGGTIDTAKTMTDIADRQARYTKGTKVGIDPVTASEVEQRLKVQTGSGVQNLTKAAVAIGEVNTEARLFKVPPEATVLKLQEFANSNPDFNLYLKARMIHEQLYANERYNQQLQQRQSNVQPKPRFYDDVTGNRWTLSDSHNMIRWYEQQNPEFRVKYRDYQSNLYETRRFVSEGPNNTEHVHGLTTEAVKRPTFPIFNQHEDPMSMFGRVLNDDSPLAILEDKMKGAMQKVLANDAHLEYINQVGTNESFTPRSPQWVAQNKHLLDREGSLIDFKVNGKKVFYTTDPLLAGLIRTGSAPLPSQVSRILSGPKRIFTWGATGGGNPMFVPTALNRALLQGATTAPTGVRNAAGWNVLPAGPISHGIGVVMKLYPQMARAMVPAAQWFEAHLNNGPLRGMPGTNLISRVLQKAYEESFYRRMEVAGAFPASPAWESSVSHTRVTQLKNQYANNPTMSPIMNYLHNASQTWNNFVKPYLGGPYRAYNETRMALSDPAFGWAWKAGHLGEPTVNGRRITDAELGARYRAYTGDPGVKGSVYTETRAGQPTTLNYQGPGKWRADTYVGVGKAMAEARHLFPWMDILIQSPAATIRALKDNPVRAGLAFTATGVLPEMVAYLWNMQQGQEYIDYMMNRRTNYNKENFIYVAIPGKPPQEGVEVPVNQESIFPRAGTRSFMHQYYGLSSQNTFDEVNQALLGFLGQTFIPPAPPAIAGLYTLSTGKLIPQGGGFFTGQSFTGRQNQLDATGNSNLEKALRQWGAGFADIGIHFHDAFTSSPKDASIWDKVDAGMRQAGHRMVSKTAGVRDIIGYRPPVTGSPEVNDELFAKDRFIKDVIQVYNVWEKRKGGISTKGFGLKPEGMAKAKPYIADPLPAKGDMIPNPGLPKDLTKNPLWNMTIKEITKTFDQDGTAGYKTMWKEYSKYSQAVRRMYAVNTGDEKEWIKAYYKENPAMPKFLEKHGVDPQDFRAVKDFYNLQRQKNGQMILYTIKATEARINKNPQVRQMLKGKDFTVEMLNPNKEGINPDEGSTP